MNRLRSGLFPAAVSAALLLASALLGGCAEGPKAKGEARPADTAALAAITQVRVVMDNPDLRAEAAHRVAHGNGPALAPADAKGVPELRLHVSCEATFDQRRPEPPINAPGSGVDQEKMNNWYHITSGALPACEGDADVVVRTLKDKGFPAMMTPGPNNLMRVLVGPYNDTPAMSKAKTELENAGFHPIKK